MFWEGEKPTAYDLVNNDYQLCLFKSQGFAHVSSRVEPGKE
jgi:hypothetical protein